MKKALTVKWAREEAMMDGNTNEQRVKNNVGTNDEEYLTGCENGSGIKDYKVSYIAKTKVSRYQAVDSVLHPRAQVLGGAVDLQIFNEFMEHATFLSNSSVFPRVAFRTG